MIETLILTFAIVAVLLFIMSIGVIFGKAPLKGSCGGEGGSCDVCSSEESCKNEHEKKYIKYLTRHLPFSKH